MDGIGKQQPNINAQGIRGAEKSAPSPGGPNQQFKDSYDTYMQAGVYALLSAHLSQMSSSQLEDQTSRYAEEVEQQVEDMQESIERSNHYEDPLYGINPGTIRRTARRLTRNHPELAQQISD